LTTYETLGIRPIINANATLTRLGGSLMPPEVIQAMNDAARYFVDLSELQQRVSEHIAELTHNEAAYVCCGAAAGLVLATAICVTDGNPDLIHCFPYIDHLKNEVIVHRNQRNGYDYAVRQVGIKVIEIGNENGTHPDDLRVAISPKTAAIFWFQGAMTSELNLPLLDVIQIANEQDIPVVVDAAAQLPPVENLWRFTEMGAALTIFSGGKDLRGPQSSGLIVGKRSLIEGIPQHGNPNAAIGRPMKVGKEELMGLLAAVERYLTLDHHAREHYCETTVADWCTTLNQIDGLTAERAFPNEAGQPLPRCLVTIDATRCGISRDGVVEKLLQGNPAISVAPHAEHQLFLNPMTLEAGEEQIVYERLIAVVQQTSPVESVNKR
jgi:D-glucosaminate-6-phosphate ammonia-lyase